MIGGCNGKRARDHVRTHGSPVVLRWHHVTEIAGVLRDRLRWGGAWNRQTYRCEQEAGEKKELGSHMAGQREVGERVQSPRCVALLGEGRAASRNPGTGGRQYIKKREIYLLVYFMYTSTSCS